jgi:hypothetical protein
MCSIKKMRTSIARSAASAEAAKRHNRLCVSKNLTSAADNELLASA